MAKMGKVEIPLVERSFMGKAIAFFFSEFFATFILVFLGCMGCVSISGEPIPHSQISFTFGLAVLISVTCFAHLSGSHLNPIVTVAAVIVGHTPIAISPVYILGQMFGAIGGFGALMMSTPSHLMGNDKMINDSVLGSVKVPGVCSPGINAGLTVFQGFCVEFITSAILAWVCCAVWDRKNNDKHDSVAVRFGLTIVALAMAAGAYTGANMNPARSFAPALFNGDWSNHWVYWVAPTLGAIVAAVFYRFVFQTSTPKDDQPEAIPLR
ncbi:PREDICTED: aquaporin AQPAe.a-like isoform X2 [Nicrophorus vespilloides]|uniref:Aquaporin AQPAe.a-like isoform X2 n=1 Tax=Nicrophorus vespilloides TaxID=110193 RepID=A0ABM1M7V0_NICVS|nr:PREDICTED: aquaporin AQPAe.a-like isoform X2 [Nicrophorus vespilloides]